MASFEVAVERTLRWEGGYVNNPNDPGGETNYGISKRSYPDVDIANLTLEQAKVIYRRDYWQFDGLQDQQVANLLFDLSVLMGQKTVIKIAQLVAKTTIDGHYGPKTQEAVNHFTPPSLFVSLVQQEAVLRLVDQVLANPRKRLFLHGWLRRVLEAE